MKTKNALVMTPLLILGLAILAQPGFGIPTNLATNGTATASSSGFGSNPTRAIDGNRDPDWANGSVWHTANTNFPHWFQVDLGADYYLDHVLIFPRNTTPYWTDFSIIVENSSSTVVYSNRFLSANNLNHSWGTSDLRGVRGRTVRIQCNGTPVNTSMAEFEVWGQSQKTLHNLSLNAVLSGWVGGFSSELNDLRDGDIDGDFGHPGYPVYHSGGTDTNVSVRLDMGSSVSIDHLNIYARSDYPNSPRVRIELLDEAGSAVYTTTNDLDGTDLNAQRYNVTLPLNRTARSVQLSTIDNAYLVLAEVEIMAAEAPEIQGSDILIQPFPAVNGTPIDDHTGQVGNLFKIPDASSGYAVKALGFYDYGGDGLAYSHKVGIWLSDDNAGTGVLLGEVTVPAGTRAPLHFGYRWVTLATPIILHPQTTNTEWYTVGASLAYGGGDPRINATDGWRYNPDLQEGYYDRRYIGGVWSTYPSAYGGQNVYYSANLSLAEIPNHGTLILIK